MNTLTDAETSAVLSITVDLLDVERKIARTESRRETARLEARTRALLSLQAFILHGGARMWGPVSDAIWRDAYPVLG